MSYLLFSSRRISTIITALSISFSMKAGERPNIIWLMAEDISIDLECYGIKAVKTPNLNALAENGIKFTNCYCTNSISSPSRSAMMTGVHQLQINAQHHRSNRDVPLPEPYKPFTYWLRQSGYTCILGSEHVMFRGRKVDCNFKHSPVGDYDGIEQFGLFDKLDVITPQDQPFFAQITLFATHRGDWWDDVSSLSSHPVNPDSVQLPPYFADHPIIRLDYAKYLDQVEYIDNEVGKIIDDLKKKGLYDNTIIIFIGDNGRCNIRGKGYLNNTGLHIPLIVNWPDGIKSGKVRNEIVTTMDITATILDWAKIAIPSYMTGKSFIRKDFCRDFVFGTRDFADEIMDKSRSIHTKQYNYIRNDMPWVPWDARSAYLEFYTPALHVMRKLKLEGELNEVENIFLQPEKPKEELYDLVADPHETMNLKDDPMYQEVLMEMRQLAWVEENALTPDSIIHHYEDQGTVDVLNLVKYFYPEEFLRMLNGEEIGYNKYRKLLDQKLIRNNVPK